MTSVRSLALALCVGLAAPLTGCPNGGVDPPPDLLTDPADVVALATRGDDALRTVAIEARATQYSDQGAFKGKLEILLRPPAAVHFSALSPTDDVVSVLTSDGARFTSFERGKSTCYTGRACPENVGRLLPIVMEGDALVGALIGRPPLLAGERTVAWDRRAGAYRLEVRGRRQLQRVWVAPGDGRVVRVQLLTDDTVDVDLRYSRHETTDGYVLPRRIDLKMKRNDLDLRLEYRHVDVNLDLADSAFAVPCPQGAAVQVLPCFDDVSTPAPTEAP